MVPRRILLLLLLVAAAHAAPAPEEETETPTEQATERFLNFTLPGSTDLSGFTGSSLMQVLVSGGAIVLALVGLAAVLALVLPLFGFKQLCYLLGTCDANTTGNTGYLAGSSLGNGIAQAYDTYHTFNQPATTYTASPTYQRRSLSYFGPILKALNTAYEKYESLSSITEVKKE